MLPIRKKIIFAITVMSLVISVGGCSFGSKKEKKPVPQPTTKVDDGNAKAKGSGEGQSDVPLVIGCGKISNYINPFGKLTESDSRIVSLTNIELLTCDRNGQVVYHAIDGETRDYNGTEYTYFGPADFDVEYDEAADETTYSVKIRQDLSFSDSNKITTDDVIFTVYAMCDKDYNGPETLGRQNIKGLDSYRKKKAKSIAGIKKIDDYNMAFTTNGYDKDFIYSLQIPICPLSYYGDKEKFDIDKNSFGFTKGDLSSVKNEHPSLLGAGAYRFVKYEKGIAYFMSNEAYYKGCPNIAYLQMKDMEDIDDTDEEELPPEATEVYMGTVDIMEFYAGFDDIAQIDAFDKDKKKSDTDFLKRFVSTQTFYGIGINSGRVHVGANTLGKKSVNLRRALYLAIQDGMEGLEDIYGASLLKMDYQCAPDSWLYPKSDDGEDENKEDKDKEDSSENEPENQMLLSCLKKAGYKIRLGKAVKAPKGAKMIYSVGVLSGSKNPVYPVIKSAAQRLKEVGITLKVVPVKSEASLGKKLKKGTVQLWAKENSEASIKDLKEYFSGKSSYFGIEDIAIIELFEKSGGFMTDEERKNSYRQCFDEVKKLYVDIPLYQQRKMLLISGKRVKADTVTQDITPYYSFFDDIHLLKK